MDDQLFVDPLAPPPTSSGDNELADAVLHEPVRVPRVDVPLGAERAIEAFTEYIHLWWPVPRRQGGVDGHVAFAHGALIEEALDGSVHVWAQIVSAAPGEMILEWSQSERPGQDSPSPAPRRQVEIRFDSTVVQERTMISVEVSSADVADVWADAMEGFSRFMGGGVH